LDWELFAADDDEPFAVTQAAADAVVVREVAADAVILDECLIMISDII
jgi:hypothetical protein